ncbi:hypothetical protein ABEB36_013844 [Hypothenemus hampei]|uniref:Uncharacterized protein n=1 Tax=Hypothenemus hampei TaxID=57062 RepID=A0ABD1E5G4_HYPHA
MTKPRGRMKPIPFERYCTIDVQKEKKTFGYVALNAEKSEELNSEEGVNQINKNMSKNVK